MQSQPSARHRFAALLQFFRSESAGGAALIGAAVLAVAWANSGAAPLYRALLDLPIGVRAGAADFMMPLHLWVNDGLMSLFFLLVGLEIRREIVAGQLASWRGVAAPGIAAIGGMAVPAMIFAAFNRHNPAALRGWAVPVATDIAFSLAVLSVLGRRVPMALKLFLTALAILDDLGAILVIAMFYTASLNPLMLALAALVWLALYGLNRAGVCALSAYVLGGIVLWVLILHSGVHATLAGVALAFVVPMRDAADGVPSPASRLEEGLDGWVAWIILPLFGLTNAGLSFKALPAGIAHDPLVLGIATGLVLGKQCGVFGASWAALRLGVARLPGTLSFGQLYGGAVLCGIGFTMSLFIGNLAFADAARQDAVKLAVFVGSLVSAVLGLGIVALATRHRDQPGRRC